MGKELLVLNVQCPNCKVILTEGTKVILEGNNLRTNEHGEIQLSAIFGDYSVRTEMQMDEGDIINFYCPHCDAKLTVETECKFCGAKLSSLSIVEGGIIEFCTRKGCKNHSIGGLSDVDEIMEIMNNKLNTPY